MAQILVHKRYGQGFHYCAVSWVGMATVEIQSEASRHFFRDQEEGLGGKCAVINAN